MTAGRVDARGGGLERGSGGEGVAFPSSSLRSLLLSPLRPTRVGGPAWVPPPFPLRARSEPLRNLKGRWSRKKVIGEGGGMRGFPLVLLLRKEDCLWDHSPFVASEATRGSDTREVGWRPRAGTERS